MLGARRSRGDGTQYARATPSRVELTETYQMEQDISKNRSLRQVGDGAGRITIRVPYDGAEFFTRQAVADVERAPAGEHRATIGHLLLSGPMGTTGLLPGVRPHGTSGSLPLSVPVATAHGPLDLTGDRQECRIDHDYRPEDPSIYPIELGVRIDDPDSMTDLSEAVLDRMTEGREEPSRIIERLRQQGGFSNELLLLLTVRVSLPVRPGKPYPRPVVKHMSIAWPALTSLRSTQLLRPGGHGRLENVPVRYNPARGRLEWQDLPVPQVPAEGELRSQYVASVLLVIGHPGELYQQRELEVETRVEIPDHLLSGLDARLFDATGRPQARPPKLTTRLHTHATVYPDDIFAVRRFLPYQQFVFDDVIPDERRITDIMTVLRHARFKVERIPSPDPQDDQAPHWLLDATRSQGPDELRLVLAVEGRHTRLAREQILAGAVKISGGKESGQLKVSVLGSLPVHHQALTREMNALQLALRDRFRFQQTSRG